MLGEFIAEGFHRNTYRHKDNPLWIIKVAKGKRGSNFNKFNILCNKYEYEVWHNAKNAIKQHLVPCLWISDTYEYLICIRGKKVSEFKIPKILKEYVFKEDMKKAKNWVEINEKTLLADYPELHKDYLITRHKYKKCKL